MRRSIVAIAGVAVLGACSSGTPTVEPDELGQKAAESLQQEVGSPVTPDIDCGDEAIDVVEGDTVDCVLSLEGDPAQYDTVITFTSVDGSEYTISSEVADTPRD